MSHKQPSPCPYPPKPLPFRYPRPPNPGETTEEYCRACDCVQVGNEVLPRTYVAWLAKAGKPKETQQ